ncbi:MAG: hypothetical protein KKD01_08110 [Proteobacteria bacterium]|nr:hypothetical protein [Pseudomonadota bacterium]MBU1454679.1 hypothetical protein [Pseudomonadota bacterium]
MSDNKAQKKIDKIVEVVQSRIGEEVGGLIGATLSLSNISTRLISKGNIFGDLSGKLVFAEIEVAGEVEGKGGLLIPIKGAIRLGGTLIMLPDNELASIVSTEDYSDELADSYGEIANLIAGAYTSTFEEMYPKACRFIRKNLEVITSVKVVAESDEPVPDQNYYQVTAEMSLNDKAMGKLIMLLPAGPFGVDEIAPVPVQDVSESVASSGEAAASQVATNSEKKSVSADTSATSAGTESSEQVAAPVPPPSVGMSPEKAKKKLDNVLEEVRSRLGEEVGGLIGVALTFSDLSTRLVSKEKFFDEPSTKLICAEIDVTGEIEGKGCLLASVKDAIRLGGTLLMIPDSELNEIVATEEYNEELADSYGEIANIIAGTYTKTFEELYPKACRIIRKELAVITPAKVTIESDEPIPDQNYYQASAAMVMNNKELGKLILLLPAAAFGVDEEARAADDAHNPEGLAESRNATATRSDTVESSGLVSESPASPQTVEAGPAVESIDIDKQKKRVDACLQECRKRMADEVGAMLGTDVKLTGHEARVVSKEDYFFDEASGKQVLAKMDVVGELEGKSYLFVGLKDAIYIGGTLVMLPPSELENVVSDEDFSEDTEDAYGEIANIISGVYTAVFEEKYPQKCRFIKSDIEKVIPLKVETDSEEPMPDQLYYMDSSRLTIGTREMGKIQMLFPATLLQLEQLGQRVADTYEQGEESGRTGVSAGAGSAAGRPSVRDSNYGSEYPDLLIVSNDKLECAKITAVLDGRNLAYKVLNYKESVTDYLPGEVRAIFLVMTDVNEKGLGVAIKISGVSSLPLIAAGPEWTRTKVIKAVKYGVDDILLTPATPGDIGEKLDSILAKMAA